MSAPSSSATITRSLVLNQEMTSIEPVAGMIDRVQIFGERRSGTNLAEVLLSNNLRETKITWEYGWKHFFHDPGVEHADNCLFLVCYRNPFDWLRSLHHRPWHAAPELKNASFSEFIRAQWWCVVDEDSGKSPTHPDYGREIMQERCADTDSRFRNVLHMRTAKTNNWESLRVKARHTLYVHYEDLISSPKSLITRIVQNFDVARHRFFKNPLRRHRPTRYGSISEQDIRFILSEMDIELERKIGYDVVQWASARGVAD